MKGQSGSKHIVLDGVFLRTFQMHKSHVCSRKIDNIYLKGRYGSTHIVFDGNLYIILGRIIDSSRIDPWWEGARLLENITLFEPFVLLLKIDQSFVTGQ